MPDRASYWLPPHEEFLPATGCQATGRNVTFFQMPHREWSCPNAYKALVQHPEYHMYQWWNPGGLSGPMADRTAERLAWTRSITPGFGLMGGAGFGLMALGGLVAIGGLTYWLLKRKGH